MKVTTFSGLEQRIVDPGPDFIADCKNVTISSDGAIIRRPGVRLSKSTITQAKGLIMLRNRVCAVTNDYNNIPTYGPIDYICISGDAPAILHGGILTSTGQPLVLVEYAGGNTKIHLGSFNSSPSASTVVETSFDVQPMGIVKSGTRACVLDRSGRYLRYSAIDDPSDPLSLTKWESDGTDTGPGYLEIGQCISGAMPAGIIEWGGRVVVFTSHGSFMVRIATDQISHVIESTINGPGLARIATVSVGSDLIYLSNAGIRSLSESATTNAVSESGVGGPIDPLISSIKTAETISSCYDPKKGLVLFAFGNAQETVIACLSRYWGGKGATGWTKWVVPVANGRIAATDKELFIRSSTDLFLLDEVCETDYISGSEQRAVPAFVEMCPALSGTEWTRCMGISILVSGTTTVGQLVVDGKPTLDSNGSIPSQSWSIPFSDKYPQWSTCRSAWPGRSFALRLECLHAEPDWKIDGYELLNIKSPRRGPV
jgi:hypothetical protein